MTQQSSAALLTQFAAVITTNGLGEISGADVRTQLQDIVDSALIKGEAGVSNLATSAVVTAAETIGSNNNDTTLPTSAAVAAYVASVGGAATIDSQQPTSDVTTITSTGFSGCKFVDVWFALSHTTTSLATYTLEARVSGGTWRTIATFDSLSGDNTSAVGGHLSICNFNQAAEKMANIDFYVGGTILDDSSATTTVNSGVGAAHTPKFAFLAWPEVWDEIRINSSVASSIEGSTADQRGRWYVAGRN